MNKCERISNAEKKDKLKRMGKDNQIRRRKEYTSEARGKGTSGKRKRTDK